MTNTFRITLLTLSYVAMGFVIPLGAEEVSKLSKIEALVKKLGDEEYSVRQQAAKDLREMGKPAENQLRKLVKHPDPEIRARVAGVLDYFLSIRKELRWLDPKNLGKPGYKSASTGQSVRLTFRNHTKKPVLIFWIETSGKLTPWRGRLMPGASAVCRRSYKGHAWLVTDSNKKHLGIYKIDIDDPILAVRDEDIKKR